ncbi:hypothetical protein [Mucilaginibacter sp. SG564]|uniref:hypothetical protein n=1 Tax=unclassified Mucilaginibacter TaxID=2617802 RepID=UPI001551F43E|nr:hypothetical protein [Mucilaginibacter sp. SG564]NOW99117.1 hypothetical protein [Mucilaginibacter sp. SG564]
MDKQTFIAHFKLLLTHLKDWTSQNCFNELSDNYAFTLEPSERTDSDHLSDVENMYLKVWNKLQGKQISFEEVINLFYQNGKTPKWVDCSIYYSTPNITVVDLLFSRQFKDESEIYYMERGTGPFKALVSIPPDHLKVMKGDKFDVNWKKRLDDSKGILKTHNL